MTLTGQFKGSSVYAKLTLMFMLISNFFNWIAFTTTYWTPGVGLWRTCFITGTSSGCRFNDGNDLEFFQATQAFVIFGFIGINVVFFLAILYVFVPQCLKNKDISFWGSIIAFVTACSYMIGVIIFAVEIFGIPSWSCWLGILAFILEVFGGVFFLLEGKR